VRDHEMHCAVCQAEMPFTAPPCDEDHEGDCPELVCEGCGSAIVVAPVTVWVRSRGTGLVPQQRSAA
jgi:hypothetical protein